MAAAIPVENSIVRRGALITHESDSVKMMRKLPPLLLALIVLCFLIYFLYGIYFGSFGANAENVMTFFRITESQQGVIMAVQSIGCIMMTIFLGLFGERINKLKGLLFGLFFMGLASVLIGTMSMYLSVGTGYILMLLFSLIGGVGYVSIDLLMNGAIADIYPKEKTTLLPLTHAFYGTGSMLSPLFVTAMTNPALPQTFSKPYLLHGILSLGLCIVCAVVMTRARPLTPYEDSASMHASAARNPAEIFSDIRAWLFLLCSLLYSCFQIGLGAWLPQYVQQMQGASYVLSNTMLSLYFAGALMMRLLSPLMYRKLSVLAFYIISNLLSSAVFLIFLFIELSSLARCALIVMMGILQGCSFPGLFILCGNIFPQRTASASALIVLGISISTCVAPAVIGRMIETVGYRLPMLSITIALVLSVANLFLIQKIGKRAAI